MGMKPAESIRECRIIKNGTVIFEGPAEKCLTVLMRLKNTNKPRRISRNSSLAKNDPETSKHLLQP